MATLVVFTRFPEAGKVKTRLIPALGARGAAELHRRMTLHTLRIARQSALPIEVRYDGGDEARMVGCFGPHTYMPQGAGDLGQRMARAIAEHTRQDDPRTLIIGADCPALTPAAIRLACDTLRHHDLVLGPATDGGYYLIGCRKQVSDTLFEGIAWGTGGVLSQTLHAARRSGWSFHLLPTLPDVDRPEDLPVWRRHNHELSVIVPTLNESACLAKTLERLRSAGDIELVVADGGSDDDTRRIAESHGARVVPCPRGRARQLNAGAAAAEGGRLLFCHADTLVPSGYEVMIARVLDDGDTALGAFSFRLDTRPAALRRVEWGANLRSRHLRLPYGDQGIFLRRETFERLGGYHAMESMEDFDLVRRAARLGRIVTLPAHATTSARKWLSRGAARVTLHHQLRIAGYCLGLDHHT